MLHADLTLARQLELAEAQSQARYCASQGRLYPDVPSAVLWVGDACAIYTGPGSPLSRASGLGMSGPVTAADLDLVEEFYHSRSVAARVDLSPFADPSLAALLGRRGYRIQMFLNVFVRSIGPNDRVTSAPSTGVTVEIIGPDEERAWADTISKGFGGEDAAPEYPNIALCSLHTPGTLGFWARVHGEPAGGGSLHIQERLAAFFGGSTRTTMRGRGVQSALLHARIAQAAAAGCDLATVKTTPGSASQRNVQRVGFVIAYTRPTLIKD
ncbi:MAG TPA: hypothetical protein VGK74_27485 [Symbiobacteriaceae bacterium]|jgi:hypothetical protein